MKTTNYAAFALLLALALGAQAGAADTRFLQGLGDPQYHHVESTAVGRGYHVYVMLPDGYTENEADTYPTLYVLDGGALFPMFASYYRYLNFGEEAPDMIVVGISYGSDNFEGGNYRSTDYSAPSEERDYWGGAEKFQQFMADELFPLIESGYRSRADRRMVFGHSIGGQFVLYTAQTQPDLFWGHIASNPALHRNLPFFLENIPEPGSTGSRLFVASGTLDDPVYREPAVAWMRHWQDRADKPWRLRTMDLEGHTHMSAPPASFRYGLRWLFFDR